MIRKVLLTMLSKAFSDLTKREVRILKSILMVTVLIVIVVAMLAGVAYANVRLVVPDEDPYAPIYADFYGNEDLVAVFFYRDPGCVPDDFDLWGEFFDFPGAFYCDLTVKGFVIYKNPGDFAPKQAKLKGLGAVPIWFVSTNDFQDALSGGLTITELENMEPMVGFASSYKEVLHPTGHPEMPMKNIVASGILDDGRSFRLHSVWIGSWPTPVHSHVTILFE